MLAHLGIIAFRQFTNEFVCPGKFGGFNDRLDWQRRIGERNVVPDTARKKHVFLQNHPDLVAKRGGINNGDILPINQHSTTIRYVKALHQLGQGRFAGPGSANDADHLTRCDLEVDRANHIRCIGTVTE